MDELEKLIAEQAEDLRNGHRVSRPDTVSHNIGDGTDWILSQKSRIRLLRQPLSIEDSRHGTYSGYRAGCTCDRCRAAAAEDKRLVREFYRNNPLEPDDPRHGTLNAYQNRMCRCDRCRKANTENQKEYQMRKNGNGT